MKISVIVPVYNSQKFLEQCLKSLINQTFKELEIICINDGSTDNSVEILNKYPQLNVIHQENKGLSFARNRGIEIAKGDYIAFVDSDDWIDLDYFEKLYCAIKETGADIACASILRTKNKYRVKYDEKKVYTQLRDKLLACDYPNCSYVWNKLYKAELVKNISFRNGVYFEDVIWTPEVLKKSQKMVVVPDTNYHYRKNSSSIVKTLPSEKKQEDLYNAKKYAIEFFENNKIKLEEKVRYVTKCKKYIGRFLYLKIKEYRFNEIYYIFGFIPLVTVTRYPKLSGGFA